MKERPLAGASEEAVELGFPTEGAVELERPLAVEPALVGLVRFRQFGRERGFGLIGEARTGFASQGVDRHFRAVEVALDLLRVEPIGDGDGQTALLGHDKPTVSSYRVVFGGARTGLVGTMYPARESNPHSWLQRPLSYR
jgi:hypothetical protein